MNTGVLSHKLRNSSVWGKLSSFTYVLYQDIRLFHQRHHLQSSGWTAHKHVTGHISIALTKVDRSGPKKTKEDGGRPDTTCNQRAVQQAKGAAAWHILDAAE